LVRPDNRANPDLLGHRDSKVNKVHRELRGHRDRSVKWAHPDSVAKKGTGEIGANGASAANAESKVHRVNREAMGQQDQSVQKGKEVTLDNRERLVCPDLQELKVCRENVEVRASLPKVFFHFPAEHPFNSPRQSVEMLGFPL
jgi:hypothetical protein